MNSAIKELYEVAQEFVRNPDECSAQQFEDALTIIELIEDGQYRRVGLVF